MRKIFIILALTVVSIFPVFGQLEAAHWYFGNNAGLDFNNLPPTAVRGQLHTEEGCSAISTPTGQLILYTDGITIYNRNHVSMPNGTGLSGDPSSSQSGLVVPHPGDATKYYVFSVDDAGGSRGLRYSLVDMTQNGGLGAVSPGQRDILLIQNVTEKVTAVANLSQNFVWVVTLGPAPRSNNATIPVNTYNSPANTIYAVKVDNSGIVNTVVHTNIGLTISPNNTHGYLKLSSDGSKLAMANFYDNTLYLMDFDNNTGVASNLHQMNIPSGFMPYGVEFSPSSEILYVKGTDNNISNAMILQYDLTQSPPYSYNIIASQSGYRGALQMAIDGKIYVAESEDYSTGRNFLSTIGDPDQLGTACNFQFHSTNTANNSMCRQGLPQFIQSFFVQIQTDNVCVGDTAHFQVTSNRDIQVVNWNYGDSTTGTSGPSASDPKVSESSHVYTTDGTYTVTAEIITTTHDTTQIQTNIEIYPLPVVDNMPDWEFCDDDQTGLITINLHGYDSNITSVQAGNATYIVKYYETQADAEADVNELSDPYTTTSLYSQTIWFSVTNTNTGCTSVGQFDIIVRPLPDVYTVSDLEECDDDDDGRAEFDLTQAVPEILNGRNQTDYTITFYASQTDAENQTNALASPYTNQTAGGETIYYTISDNITGCTNIGSFNLVVHPKPEIDMDDEYIVCQNDSTYVEAPAGFVAYNWSTGETTQGIYVYHGGDYTVTVTDSFGCTNSKEIHVRGSGPATIDDVVTVDFNGNDNSITVYVSGNGDYEYSIDGVNYQNSNTFDHLYPGTYTVYVRDKNGCGVVSVEVDLLGAPPYFTPNGDGTHDYWQVINVYRMPGTQIFVYDRYGVLMAQFTDADPGWDGTYNGIPQPATDYWFLVILPDGRKVKGHFSLIR